MRRLIIVALLTSSTSLIAQSISFGSAFYYDSNYPTKWTAGDRWTTTWADDGNIYTTGDDTGYGWTNDLAGSGGRNLWISTISGYTSSATGTTVNSMDDFGTFASTGCSGSGRYKSYGLTSISGTMYLFVACDIYNSTSPPYIETVSDAQLVKSTDHFATYTPHPPSPNHPYASPMFSGTTFPTPMFVQYGQDGACPSIHNCSTYVYAVSNEGCWNNCSKMILGRVSRANIANLSATDWTFYQGGDGMSDGNWGAAGTAASIISNTNKVSMTGVQYLSVCSCYIMLQWYYPGVPTSINTQDTTWDIYTSPTPWGTWTKIQSTNWNGSLLGYYNPTVVPPSISGGNFTIALAGNFNNTSQPGAPYTLILLPATFTPATAGSSSISSGMTVSAGVAIQ